MTTIEKELSSLRQMIKEVADDTKYTDSYLYDIWNKQRVIVLTQETAKTGILSPWNNSRFCIELEKTKSHNCECVAEGCDVLKTVHEVPAPISDKYIGNIIVSDLFGNIIGYSTEEALKSDQLDDVKKGKVRWSLYNRKIVIWNNLAYPAIQVNGPWEDITDWMGIQYCTDDIPCRDVFEENTGLTEKQAAAALTMAFNALFPTKQIIDDWTSEGNPEKRV